MSEKRRIDIIVRGSARIDEDLTDVRNAIRKAVADLKKSDEARWDRAITFVIEQSRLDDDTERDPLPVDLAVWPEPTGEFDGHAPEPSVEPSVDYINAIPAEVALAERFREAAAHIDALFTEAEQSNVRITIKTPAEGQGFRMSGAEIVKIL